MSSSLILFEGDFLVFNKPSGMSVHNEKPSLREEMFTRGYPALHFVNRLDAETSGLVVATKDAGQVEALKEALSHEDARKIYRGIVKSPSVRAQSGQSQSETPPTSLKWDQALSDKAEGRKDPLGPSKTRVPALTLVQHVGGNEWFWELEFQIKTGRQHQIRKHCAFHQMPLLGDKRYGREALNKKSNEIYGVDRLCLHAHRLEFVWRGKRQNFEAPIPNEFSKILYKL